VRRHERLSQTKINIPGGGWVDTGDAGRLGKTKTGL